MDNLSHRWGEWGMRISTNIDLLTSKGVTAIDVIAPYRPLQEMRMP